MNINDVKIYEVYYTDTDSYPEYYLDKENAEAELKLRKKHGIGTPKLVEYGVLEFFEDLMNRDGVEKEWVGQICKELREDGWAEA